MIHIITGSTLGGAEYVGDHLNDLLEEQGHEITLHNQPEYDDIPQQGFWLLVTSTHGAGEFPDNIKPFIDALTQQSPDLSQVRFAVVALGDSSYDTFCLAGKSVHSQMKELGAQPISDCFTIDVLETPVPEDAAEAWFNDHSDQF
ncbi:flavoprotein MioC [Vibrio crassostreae]|uniref:Protein mioC n=1 Tax=Vibrio crassostreae TaxID=246167 RepID=A0A822MVL3_9VIBR|nr:MULTISPECIES: FMN-binding protein MioC [Vibrio]MCX2760387.1 FMN-binding protein MioC [Vibrio sp. 14G-20]MCX2777271.1 FMN-binding protein MioC [Vibrio sp. Sgm 22]MDH5951383.1 FMN-binding protein MioC [Vibrio crassostreae]PMI20167.1 FMN-binding protein MioC [Vibrio sp. 10N.286.46.E10]PMI86749.1 FMN-binding protein MioC [Vibrio sp. 10N.286.45.E10]